MSLLNAEQRRAFFFRLKHDPELRRKAALAAIGGTVAIGGGVMALRSKHPFLRRAGAGLAAGGVALGTDEGSSFWHRMKRGLSQTQMGQRAGEYHAKAQRLRGYAPHVGRAGLLAGKSVFRTLTLGEWSPESLQAKAYNLAGEVAEDMIHRRIMKSADRLSQNAAMLVGITQQHLTERAISKADKLRAEMTGIVGAPSADELKAEQQIVKEMQRLVRKQVEDLGRERQLRTRRNKIVDKAATAATIRMQARKRGFEVVMGHIDPDILKDLQKEYPGAFTQGDMSELRLRREAQRKAETGSTMRI